MSSTIPGNLHVANDVLADLVGNAAMECYGVVGVCAPNAADSIAKILPASRLRRGVVVSSLEEGVHVDLYIVVEYGTNIATVDGSVRNYKYYDIVGYWIFGTDYTSARQHYDLTYPDNQ